MRTFSEQDPIRVFLLDDHEVVRRGLADLLDAEPDICVVGDADTGARALVRGPALRPHVAVLDVRLPDGDGISVCRELRDRMPELACLTLTSFDDEEALLDKLGVQRRVHRRPSSPPTSTTTTPACTVPTMPGTTSPGDPM